MRTTRNLLIFAINRLYHYQLIQSPTIICFKNILCHPTRFLLLTNRSPLLLPQATAMFRSSVTVKAESIFSLNSSRNEQAAAKKRLAERFGSNVNLILFHRLTILTLQNRHFLLAMSWWIRSPISIEKAPHCRPFWPQHLS
jgi:hypothetical protein